jgi:hypothetical protein
MREGDTETARRIIAQNLAQVKGRPMSKSNLATYLNDHLAGCTAALDLIGNLERLHRGTNVSTFLISLRSEILADRQELEALMSRQKIATSPPRKAMAWISEKLAEIKLNLDDRAGGPLHLLEALEAIALGIDGKRALWRALASARVGDISVTDLQQLERRAGEQRDRIEAFRLVAAQSALRQDADVKSTSPKSS